MGEVWQYRLDGALVALKRVKNDTRNASRSKKILETFLREVTKMLNLRHPNIISFCGACLLEATPCIALELARGGTFVTTCIASTTREKHFTFSRV